MTTKPRQVVAREAAVTTRPRPGAARETMEDVLEGMDKVLLEENAKGGSGVVPYLPLNELRKERGADSAAQQGGSQQ